MSQLALLPDPAAATETQWIAESMQLVNWGGLHGHTPIELDPEATLISGASGTGRSTILDGYLALMMPSDTPFNGASNDASGRARNPEQRNLLTYLRGKTDDSREAGFPSRKAIEEFNFDHQPGLSRDTIAHLTATDFGSPALPTPTTPGGWPPNSPGYAATPCSSSTNSATSPSKPKPPTCSLGWSAWIERAAGALSAAPEMPGLALTCSPPMALEVWPPRTSRRLDR
jgi:P-loop containing region of AAA domain